MRIIIELDRPTPRRPRRLLAALVACVALIIPAVAVANHQFTDVPAESQFHGDITKAYGARITAGCTATRFCPENPVTRGQMTAFLNRGLGRLAQGNLSGTLITTGAPATLGSVTIQAGNVPGGTASVYLAVSVNVYAGTAGCPCEMRMELRDQNGTPVSPYVLTDLPAIAVGDNDTDELSAVQGVAVVPTGVERTFSVVAIKTLGTANLVAYGKLDAIYVPFNGVGASPAEAPVPVAGADEERGR